MLEPLINLDDARIAYEARMNETTRGEGRKAVQDEILKVLSLDPAVATP